MSLRAILICVGGGVYIGYSKNVTRTHNTIQQNQAMGPNGSFGGGVGLVDSEALLILSVDFSIRCSLISAT